MFLKMYLELSFTNAFSCFTLFQVRAGESLMKLVSDIKEFLILNDFPSANAAIAQRTRFLRNVQAEVDEKIMQLRDEMSLNLFELEKSMFWNFIPQK